MIEFSVLESGEYEVFLYYHFDHFFFFFNDLLNFMPKAILVEKEQWYYLTYGWVDKGVYSFD